MHLFIFIWQGFCCIWSLWWRQNRSRHSFRIDRILWDSSRSKVASCELCNNRTHSTDSIKICFRYFEHGRQRVRPITFQLYRERDFSGNRCFLKALHRKDVWNKCSGLGETFHPASQGGQMQYSLHVYKAKWVDFLPESSVFFYWNRHRQTFKFIFHLFYI